MADHAHDAQTTDAHATDAAHATTRTEYAQTVGNETDTPEEEYTQTHGRILISPPEGFDAYQAAHEHDEHAEHEHIHIPPPSFWPLLLAIAITMAFTGFLVGPALVIAGVVLMLVFTIGWCLQGTEDRPTALTEVPVIGARSTTDALTQGALVLTRDGRAIGRVTRASENSPLVRAGWIPTRHGYLARKFIDHIEEGAIVLTLTEDEVRARANVTTERAGPGAGNLTLPAANPTPIHATSVLTARSESQTND